MPLQQNIYPPINAGVVHPMPQRALGQAQAPPPVGSPHLMTQEWVEFFLDALGFSGFRRQPFVATDFGPLGDWVVDATDVVANDFFPLGLIVTVSISLRGTTVANTPAVLSQVLPGGFTVARDARVSFTAINNGVPTAAFATVVPGGTTIDYTLANGANWANATDATDVDVNFTFEIQG